jgi:hypothetical protein
MIGEMLKVNNFYFGKDLIKFIFKILDDDLNKHLANSFLSIYLNSSSDNSKYLVIYDDDDSLDLATNNNLNNTNPSSAEIIQDNHNYNPKRIKLDHFAFINKLK